MSRRSSRNEERIDEMNGRTQYSSNSTTINKNPVFLQFNHIVIVEPKKIAQTKIIEDPYSTTTNFTYLVFFQFTAQQIINN